MKIVVLGLRGFPNIQGGVETHCEHLFTRMAARGHEVSVLCRQPYMESTLTQFKGVHLLPLPCPRKRSLEAFLHTFLGVLRARTMGPDILHIHAIGPSLFVPLARLLGLRVVSTNHGPDYDRAKWGYMARTILRMGETMGSRFSSAVVAISEPIAQHLRDRYGCKPFVIPNGVVPRAPSESVSTLQQFGLEPGRYLLAVARLVPEKGLHDLLDAFAMAKLEGWKLAIAGGADHEDAYSLALKAKAATMPNVVMTGFVSGQPLVQLYSHAGLFVLPSYHEGLPIVLLEAMGYGLPVVVSDIPANRQVELSDDRFFPAGNIEQASERIKHHAPRRFTPEQKAAQIAYIARAFNWDNIADATLGVYRSLLSPAAK
jgi:glycosyltransferase involved in cell wall biosynthesis